MPRTALILAGHGSHISPETAGIVWQQVDKLRQRHAADEITAAFWKEAPSFHQVLSTLTADDITIVPLFTAQGYFTQTVIPAEMQISSALTEHDGRIIRYGMTLSEHPYLSRVVRQRIADAMQAHGAERENTAIALIGHGTRRNPESRSATRAQAEQVRDMARESVAVFLDDTPAIPDIYTLTSATTIIAVPFFLALGSHTTIDVPGELGLASGATYGHINGRDVIYTPPVGIGDDLDTIILEIARAAGMPEPAAPQIASTWDCFPAAGRDALIEAVRANGWIEFGQLTLTLHEVRPTEIDIDREIIEISDAAVLRDHVRRHSAENPDAFRPLATATDLPRDWVVRVEKRAQLHAVVETVYPGLVAEWSQREPLEITPLGKLVTRQTGNYRALSELTAEQEAQVVASVCGRCVRQPTWHNGVREPLPCPEACNFWMSRALEVLEPPTQETSNT
jgi:sirohydrochlorin cobaltochelatase